MSAARGPMQTRGGTLEYLPCNLRTHTCVHRLRYSHSWGLHHESIQIRIRMDRKIFVKKKEKKKS